MDTFQVAAGKLKHKKVLVPKLQSGWALVRVRLAGICNTDIEILRGYHDFRGTLGHEFVGEVADVRGVSVREQARWIGRRVVGEINVCCSAYGHRPVCGLCLRGFKTHCARRTVLGIVAHDGAFAEYLALPVENLRIIPDAISDEQAVFVEPLAAACEILDQINVTKFNGAAVLGDGKLAQLIARVLRTRLRNVVMYGKHEKKLALARSAGIKTKRIRGHASDLQRVEQRYGLVVEATGSPTGLSLGSARHGTEGHFGSEVDISWGRPGGNLADRSERTHCCRVPLWTIWEGHRPSSLRQNRSNCARYPHVSTRGSAGRDSIRARSWSYESAVKSQRLAVWQGNQLQRRLQICASRCVFLVFFEELVQFRIRLIWPA